jgi:hypothetical protein
MGSQAEGERKRLGVAPGAWSIALMCSIAALIVAATIVFMFRYSSYGPSGTILCGR